ncbi:MAG: gliding motility-associated C-terminal domain-containing protein [Elusimicrobiota bacterium]|nr:gliding motility-associated C-terminal domain-containing protein [Elusimicrobiota bacterium]MDH5661919.1 gliding motility-associated C-terminal domain-containing protein [Elusimicrobiota bacterium]
MRKINYSVKVILVSSVLFILECAQLGGRTEEYYRAYVDGKFAANSFEIKVRPDKIFTPNGDGWNDYLEIQYDNPYDAIVSGKIYDIKGRLVARMVKEESKERLTWNGNDLSNNPVVGGLYIYQVEVSGPENKVIKGTIVLVR